MNLTNMLNNRVSFLKALNTQRNLHISLQAVYISDKAVFLFLYYSAILITNEIISRIKVNSTGKCNTGL